ncbi:MAG: 4Fe-4S binding protein [bacterium]
MAKRKIIKINEEKCNGCSLCIPNCPEGALQIIDGKVRLISDLFCDGLGACIGHCPEGAIKVEEREAEPYDESKVMENIVKQGENVIKAHLLHLKEHNEQEFLSQALGFLKKKKIPVPSYEHGPAQMQGGGCPGTKATQFEKKKTAASAEQTAVAAESQLTTWPVQIKLIPSFAPFLKDADLIIAADCVPFAYPNFHEDFLKGKKLLIGCPKLDDAQYYKEKFTSIFKDNNIKSVTCLHMEVPCCFGLVSLLKSAIAASGKNIPFSTINISIKGEKISD